LPSSSLVVVLIAALLGGASLYCSDLGCRPALCCYAGTQPVSGDHSMIATLFSILTTGALAAPVPDQPDAAPKGPPPLVMTVQVGPEGQVLIPRTVTEMVPQERTEKVRVGNQIVDQKVTVFVPVQKQVSVALDSKDVQVFTPDGKRVDPK